MESRVFWIPRRKAMQIHLEIISKSQFWTRNVRNWTKTLTPVNLNRTELNLNLHSRFDSAIHYGT